MKENIVGNIYDIQRFSVHDGPGIRTDIFLSGCPLTCFWCHSPESQSLMPQLAWFEIRCIGTEICGLCIPACPKGAISAGERKMSDAEKKEIQLIKINRELCDNCGECVQVCPAKALSLTAKEMTLDEVMDIIERDRQYYIKSNGGVTISGGEPMVQYRFTNELLKLCKEKGLHTCLDTTGYAKWEHYEEILPYVDLFLYDLKHMNSSKSKELTGVENHLILENIQKLAAAGSSIQVRVPVIPGLNDSDENLHATGKFCRELGDAVVLVQLLPYHRLGAVKYDRIGKEYQLSDIEAPDDKRMEEIKKLLEIYDLTVKIH